MNQAHLADAGDDGLGAAAQLLGRGLADQQYHSVVADDIDVDLSIDLFVGSEVFQGGQFDAFVIYHGAGRTAAVDGGTAGGCGASEDHRGASIHHIRENQYGNNGLDELHGLASPVALLNLVRITAAPFYPKAGKASLIH